MTNYLESEISKFVGNKKSEQLDVTELNINELIKMEKAFISKNADKFTKQMEIVAKTVFRAKLVENEYNSIESHRMCIEAKDLFKTLFPSQDVREAIDYIQSKEVLTILEEAEDARLFVFRIESDWKCNEYFFLEENDGLTAFERENGIITTNFNCTFQSKYNVSYDIDLPAELRKVMK